MRKSERKTVYREIAEAADSILAGEKDPIIWMSILTSLLKEKMDFLWVGFYRVLPDGDQLLGPFQGSLPCLRIPSGKGACGMAAARGHSIAIPNVDEFPAHIACDSRSCSEIVIPVKDEQGRIRAILDIDSIEIGYFGPSDSEELEAIVEKMKGLEWGREFF